MAPEQFFLITHGDGDIRVHRLTEVEIIQCLAVDEESGVLTYRSYRWDEKFDTDPNYWEAGRHLIIKGTVVTPQPTSIRYELR